MAKKGMNLSLFIGLGIGVGGLIVGYVLEKGNPLSLIGISALIMIVTGTVGALVISFGLGRVLGMFKALMGSMKPPNEPSPELVLQFVELSERARKEGLLSLEEVVDQLDDEFMRKGLQLVVDGTESEVISDMLGNEIDIYEHRIKEDAALFDTAGGFSPTIGIIGTVMGLVLVLSHLGGDPSELGHSIAAAFIATLYGVGLANLVFLPVGNSIKNKAKVERLQKEMVVEAVLSIQRGESPGLVRQKLATFLEDKDREKVKVEEAK